MTPGHVVIFDMYADDRLVGVTPYFQIFTNEDFHINHHRASEIKGLAEVVLELEIGEVLQKGEFCYMRAGPDELKLLALGLFELFLERPRRRWNGDE